MKPQSVPADALELSEAHFDQLLNPEHPRVALANQFAPPPSRVNRELFTDGCLSSHKARADL